MKLLNDRVSHDLPLTEAECDSGWALSPPPRPPGRRGGSVDFHVRCGYVAVGMDALSFSMVRCPCVQWRIAEVAALVVDSCSGMCMAGFTGVAPRAVFLPSVVRPKMLDTLARVNQKDSFQWSVLGSCCWLRRFRALFHFIVGRPVLPGIMHFLDHSVRCPLCNDRFPAPDSAEGGAVLGQVVLAHRCATTGAGVGPDSVQLLDKIGDMPVVGPHGTDSAQAGRDSTGAVLGQGHGHARCRPSWPRQS